jgi:hypothetical protein
VHPATGIFKGVLAVNNLTGQVSSHLYPVALLAFSPHGNVLAWPVASRFTSGQARLWRAADQVRTREK